MFLPFEQFDEPGEIDLVFSQVIADCRKNNAFRIRPYEREIVSQILRESRDSTLELFRPIRGRSVAA
jgi:hypothetical protein